MVKNYAERKFREYNKDKFIIKLQVNILAHTKTLCDFLIFKKNRTEAYEIKQITEPSKSINKVRLTQLKMMLEFSKVLDCYFIFCFKSKNSRKSNWYKIPVNDINSLFIKVNKKSLNEKDLEFFLISKISY